MKTKTKNYITLITTIILIIAADRLLLFYLGLPLWEWDEKLHYKHRKNKIRYWDDYDKKPIGINEYGQHDDSFPIEKGKNELRILNLGDSITMGHGVTKDETYSKYLETILTQRYLGSDALKDYTAIQAINAGVQGYSTFQEFEVLKRDTIFEPDIVTVGFCLNDVTEPFAVNENLGGTGLDYHRVTQAQNRFLSYLLNETGFGRLIQEIRIRKLDARQEKLAEIYDVKKMLMNPNDSKYMQQWNFVLGELNKIYSFCKSQKIPVVLLIFPYTFQFSKESAGEETKLTWTQNLLAEHAMKNEGSAGNEVVIIDYLKLFRETFVESSQNPIGSAESIDESRSSDYFLDENHFTPKGHKFVAEKLSEVIMTIVTERSH